VSKSVCVWERVNHLCGYVHDCVCLHECVDIRLRPGVCMLVISS
jgi:hypothetical protein